MFAFYDPVHGTFHYPPGAMPPTSPISAGGPPSAGPGPNGPPGPPPNHPPPPPPSAQAPGFPVFFPNMPPGARPHSFSPLPHPAGGHPIPYPYGYIPGMPPAPMPLPQLFAQLQGEQEAQRTTAEEAHEAQPQVTYAAPEGPPEGQQPHKTVKLHRQPTLRRKTSDERLAEIEAERTRLLARRKEREQRQVLKAELETQRAAEAAAAIGKQRERERARRAALTTLQAHERERQRRMAAETELEAEELAEEQEETEGRIDWPTLLGALLGLFLEDNEPKKNEEIKPAPAPPAPTPAPTAAAPAAAPKVVVTETPAAAPVAKPAEAAAPEPTEEPTKDVALHHVQLLLAAYERLSRSFAFPRVLAFAEPHSPSMLTSKLHAHLAFAPQNAPVHTYEQALNQLLADVDGIPSTGDPAVRKARRELVKKVEHELAWLEEEVQRAWDRKQAEEQEEEEPEEPLQDVEEPNPEGEEEIPGEDGPATEEELAETKAALDAFLAKDPTVESFPNIAALEAEAFIAAAEAEDVPTDIPHAGPPVAVPVVEPADEQSQDEQVIVDKKKEDGEVRTMEEEVQMNAPENYEFVEPHSSP